MRELEITRRLNEDGTLGDTLLVSIASDTERDMGVKADPQDLILNVARMMGWSVMINKQGGAEQDLGVTGGE